MQVLKTILNFVDEACKVQVRWHIYFILLLITSSGVALGQGTTVKEYQLKAVFLYNFAQFVDWPSNSFNGDDAPLVIGIMGEDPFGAYLRKQYR